MKVCRYFCAVAALICGTTLVYGQVVSVGEDAGVARLQDLRQSGIYYIEESKWPEYGVPGDVNVYPSYDERGTNVWINVVCHKALHSAQTTQTSNLLITTPTGTNRVQVVQRKISGSICVRWLWVICL